MPVLYKAAVWKFLNITTKHIKIKNIPSCGHNFSLDKYLRREIQIPCYEILKNPFTLKHYCPKGGK